MADMLSIPLSPELTEALQSVGGAARERLAVSLFREGRLSPLELSKVLELDRFEIDAVLKRHQVARGSLTQNDLEMDSAVLDRVLGPAKK